MNGVSQYLLLILFPLAGVALVAAPMSGVYTCAKGNPGGVFDYADIGDFFDDLEDNGVNGPTTLDVYDDGGPFTSNDSYLLGADVTSSTSGWLITGDLVAGVNTLRPLTIRAAKGEVPVIYGAGAPGIVVGQGQPPLANAWGGLSFFDTSNVTLEGLVIVGGGGFGILFYCHNAPECDSIRVRKCTISDVSWSAICFHGKHTSMNDVVIENNMCWGSLDGDGVIDGGPPSGQNWVVRNNTILTRDGSVVTSAFSSGSTQPWDVLEGNVAVVASSGAPRYFLLGGATTIDHNVVSLSGVGQMGTAYPTWTDWQAAGFDINGVNADPMFENATQWQEDLRLRPGSPAIDLIPFSSLADDVFGNPRPSGLAIDAGAHELQVPNQPAQALAEQASAFTALPGDVLWLGLDGGTELPGNAYISLTDLEGDSITVTALTPSGTLPAGIVPPALPAPDHEHDLFWTGTAPASGSYSWFVEFEDSGSGTPSFCTVTIQVISPPPGGAAHSGSGCAAGRVHRWSWATALLALLASACASRRLRRASWR